MFVRPHIRESGKFLHMESGILGLGIQNPRRGIQNPRLSWFPLHEASCGPITLDQFFLR